MFYSKNKSIMKINYQLILLVISVGLSLFSISKNELAIYNLKQNPDFNIGETPEKVCYFGINSIISGNVQSHYYSTDVFEYLKDNPTILNLNSDDKIINIYFRDDVCKVIVKNESGMRGFNLPLEKSMSYPLFYRISTIKEEDINSFELINPNNGGKNATLSSN